MKNRSLSSLLVVVSSVILLSNVAHSKGRHQAQQTQYAFATVLSAEPITKLFKVSEPEQQCFKEKVLVREYSRPSHTNRVLSTFLGAAIGSALGHKSSNKRIGAYAGAMLGSAIADDAARNSSSMTEKWVNRCETVSVNYQQERVIGYRVTYLFHGETYTTRLKRNPGNSLRVKLSVTPMID